ncbi:hypothetical protein [Methylobacterium oxalidis]|uniref:hypothetical protein n=1 Tax=Methylobacterium oxalidis TaxID=944322 RepID=UPI0033148554
MSIEIIITPSKRHRHHYDAYLGYTLLCTSRIPFFDGARVLLSEGHDPNTPLAMRHQGSAHASLRSTIGSAAKLTVVENGRDGPVFGAYEPYPLKEKRKAEKLSASRIKSEHQGSLTSGNGAVSGA